MRDLCSFQAEDEGYRLTYRIARDNLLLGNNVIADSRNPIELTRREWENVAIGAGAGFINIEVICSSTAIHKRRVEQRTTDIPDLRLPSWQDVVDREYHPWKQGRIVIDTTSQSETESFGKLLNSIQNN